MRIPVISIGNPWAAWLMMGWKTIETRTHPRLASLSGKVIGIHAAQKWDEAAIFQARPFLTDEQIQRTETFLRVGGAIIGTAKIGEHRPLTSEDSEAALIDCATTQRWGLIIESVNLIEAIPMRGKQGIWYAEIPSKLAGE
jgi:hypothetical protein